MIFLCVFFGKQDQPFCQALSLKIRAYTKTVNNESPPFVLPGYILICRELVFVKCHYPDNLTVKFYTI
jgi:hypothetical protein